jgi:hypothetical protein
MAWRSSLIIAPANPNTERKKVPEYSTIRSNNLRVSGVGDGRSGGNKQRVCQASDRDWRSGATPRVGDVTQITDGQCLPVQKMEKMHLLLDSWFLYLVPDSTGTRAGPSRKEMSGMKDTRKLAQS